MEINDNIPAEEEKKTTSGKYPSSNEHLSESIKEDEDFNDIPELKIRNHDVSFSTFLSRGCCQAPQNVKINTDESCSCGKLHSSNWMNALKEPALYQKCDCVEIRFKNSRKEFFRLPEGMEVGEGDIVAVEGLPGHDIGIVELAGEIVRIQMKKKGVSPNDNLKKVFRRAKISDVEKWVSTVNLEDSTRVEARKIAIDEKLAMKLNDVEFQGDASKAIFYYTADERVDFRNLIKVLADKFKVRIEMRQIGIRQEASRLGGIAACGRELCCATWLTNFRSVTTNAARVQQISLNPQKLAGQCGKLKCCLNYEYDVYVDEMKDFPNTSTPLKTKKGNAFHRKTDVFKRIMWYSYQDTPYELMAISVDSANKIIAMNKKNQTPEQLDDYIVEMQSSGAVANQEQEKTDWTLYE